MILEAIDRASAPAKRIQASMRNVGKGARQMGRDLKSNDPVYARGYALGERLRGGLDRVAGGFRRAGLAARRAAGAAGLAAWNAAARNSGNIAQWLGGKIGGLIGSTAQWAAAGATAAGGFALFDLFRTASQFEQFQIMLENMEGSAAKAKKSFDWVKQFAQKTPYELAEVMEAFVKLKAYGLDPMNGSLKAAGDAAAGMSKPIMQAVEAIADAVTGENERLKEFGIVAKDQGDKVAFTYRKAGKEITKTARKGAEVEKVLTGIFSDRFGGMMDRQSKTMAGMISNLKDQWSNFLMMVADAGIFDLVKSKVAALLEKVNQWAKDGSLKRWAETVSDRLEKMWKWAEDFINKTDWAKVQADLKVIADAAVILANAIKTAVEWGQKLSFLNNLNPAWLATKGLSQAYDLMNAPAGGSAPAPAPAPRNNADFFNGSGGGRRAWNAPRKTAANDVNVGGAIRLQVEAAPGTRVRTAGIDQQGSKVPVIVDLGRSMAGAA